MQGLFLLKEYSNILAQTLIHLSRFRGEDLYPLLYCNKIVTPEADQLSLATRRGNGGKQLAWFCPEVTEIHHHQHLENSLHYLICLIQTKAEVHIKKDGFMIMSCKFLGGL